MHGGFGPGDRQNNPLFLARGPWLQAPSSAGVLAVTVRVGENDHISGKGNPFCRWTRIVYWYSYNTRGDTTS